jgi:integrase/recombinase XerD
VRLTNAVHVFLSEWPSEGASPATVEVYRGGLAWLCRFAGDQAMLKDLTPSLVRRAASAKMGNAESEAYNYKGGEAAASLIIQAAKAMARWLGTQGLPVADLGMVKAPRVPKRIQPRLYADEFQLLEAAVLRRLLSANGNTVAITIARDLALLHLLGETGLRAQEVCNLQLHDLDLERGWVTVRGGKGKKDRALSVVGAEEGADRRRVVRLLEDWIAVRATIAKAREHSVLWTSYRGMRLSAAELRALLHRICIEAGLPGNRPPHSFRRYVFTEHYRSRSVPIQHLVARMGWTGQNQQMLETYSRGAELELAKEPLPLLNSRPIPGQQRHALVPVAAGPARVEFDPTATPPRTGKSAARRALTNPQRAGRTAP